MDDQSNSKAAKDIKDIKSNKKLKAVVTNKSAVSKGSQMKSNQMAAFRGVNPTAAFGASPLAPGAGSTQTAFPTPDGTSGITPNNPAYQNMMAMAQMRAGAMRREPGISAYQQNQDQAQTPQTPIQVPPQAPTQ